MRNKLKATGYAKILFDVCEKDKKEEIVLNQLNEFVKGEELDVFKILTLPTNTKDLKINLLSSLEKTDIEIKFLNFLKILVNRDDFELLKDISKEYENIFLQNKNIERIHVEVAKELSIENQEKLKEGLENKLNKKVEISFEEDKGLIAGVKIKWDNKEIDNTIKKHLRDFISQI